MPGSVRSLPGHGLGERAKSLGTRLAVSYLIYTLTDSYAAVRFDAWKSLQTLPGFLTFLLLHRARSSARRSGDARL